MPDDGRPAHYFPVRRAPYGFEAGLHRFGTDFGNGAIDRLYFQRDDQAERYRRAKAAIAPTRNGVRARTADERAAHRAVLAWIQDRLEAEHDDPGGPLPVDDPARAWALVADRVQEDLVVLLRDRVTRWERAIAVWVAAPSGWRPERILGSSFAEIHAPVPGFADRPAQAASMVSSMIDRGPYVRFVWTIAADDHLDHHPEEGRRLAWREDGRGWLRVERQVTVPFPGQEAALFLIRTYLYPFEELPSRERTTLHEALAAMPDEVARYKGLDGEARAIARRLLNN